MSGGIFSIKLDEYTPGPSPGPSPPASAAQARKSDRACDFCRRRKTRCDGAQTNKSKCTNCRRNQCPCTYLEASRPRGPSKAYVTALEDRIERFDRLFKRLRPEADFTNILGPPIPRGSWKSELDSNAPKSSKSVGTATSSRSTSLSHSVRVSPHTSMLPPMTLEDSYSDSDSYEEDNAGRPRSRLPARKTSRSLEDLTEDFSVLGSFGNNEESSSIRFHGKSSVAPLVNATRHYVRASAGHDGFHDVRVDGGAPLSDACRTGICKIPKGRRDIYWTFSPWEEAWERKHAAFTALSPSPSPSSSSGSSQDRLGPLHEFPQSDLTLPLLSLYFHHTNSIFPLLHAPTFYSHFRNGLHLRDAQFAGIVWCLMAIASRWSQDRRVLWDGWGSEPSATWQPETEEASDEDLEWASAGWRFFLRSLDGPSFTVTSLEPPSLFDIQFCSLGAMFLRGSSIHAAGWVVVGAGLRKAMDVGAHRRKTYSLKPSVGDELWKRAFWMLILFDRMGSAGLGRPCCVRDEDIDLDPPLEVDDEYWIPNDPSWPAFKQPSDKPSVLSGFVTFLKLSQIMGHTMRTIYCIDKSKVLLGLVSDGWQEQIVSQLNTALDEWVESVPEHLRWSSGIENDIFANQSATIYTSYYLALILIYRPFSQASVYLPQQDIPAKPKVPFPFPADSICSNSAHAAIRIIEVQTRRGLSNIPNLIAVSQVCAATLLMGLHASQAGHKGDPETIKGENERVMRAVEKCTRCLELAQSRWIMARKFLSGFSAFIPSEGALDIIKGEGNPAEQYVPQASGMTRVHVDSFVPVAFSHAPVDALDTDTNMLSQMSDHDQASMERGNWQWFRENPMFDQQRSDRRHSGDPLRYHVPLLPSPHSSVSESPSASSTPAVPETIDYGRRAERGRKFSSQSAFTPPPPSLPVPDQPISSTSRLVRASRTERLLSVTPPQSAARDELVGQKEVRVPQHPYATLNQTSQHALRRSTEKRSSGRGNAGFDIA